MLKSIATAAALFTAATLLPLAAAARTKAPVPETPNLATEGAALIQAVEADADSVRFHANTLVSFNRSLDTSWQTHAAELTVVKDRVNDLAQKLHRLEAIREQLPEWQQKAVARIEPAAIEMAYYTRHAILFLNEHPMQLFSPDYTGQTAALDTKAVELSKTLRNYETYAKASTTEAQMEETLGLKNSD